MVSNEDIKESLLCNSFLVISVDLDHIVSIIINLMQHRKPQQSIIFEDHHLDDTTFQHFEQKIRKSTRKNEPRAVEMGAKSA